ncbi:RHS repeat-associated core domain-containing protein [Pseudomonas sp. HS6]|uniref:RHS repeat-associated core domain-containing protein n=1 Tax=Pseudomonas sp. HS6 TaxID=2850559 RepID=UPI0020189133|nr:RHS repeat-associated core domain-containing protein [Pseudomonas sp. HS6]UQS17913.1 RHS repeat-associated core domain-containing protein [Pseudomonas sp. HS6]
MSASVHWQTPALQVHDPRALGIRQVEYLRQVAGEDVQALITRQQHDVAGRPVAQRDPRLPTPNNVTVFALNGQALKTVNVDSGTHVTLPGQAGESRHSWDSNGNHRLTTYDDQLRPLSVAENDIPDVETFTYATATADPGHNLRGQLIEQSDPSGIVDFHSIGLMGNGMHETRTFHDAKAFVSRRGFSPLGTVLETIDAGGHKQQSTYDVAGQLSRVHLQLNGQSNWQTVLQEARYNAAGQIIEQHAGNDVTSRWHYRATDGRLRRQYTQKGSESTLQDFEYEHDRMGNITSILDHVYTPTFFRNQRVDGHREFSYDSLSRLIRATGYADSSPSDKPGRPLPTDPAARRNYIEHYDYDHGNNLVKTIHVRDGASHTFEMSIDSNSNRGARWKPGDPPPDFPRLFDPAGNLQVLQPGMPMHWNKRGELEKVTLVDRNGSSANDEEYYRYSQGTRLYKRHDTHTTKVSHFHEVRDLQDLEIRTKDNGEELHLINVGTGIGNVVCLHWVTGIPSGIANDQLRYTLGDHLGSVAVELDQQAQMISQEGYLPFGATAWMAARTLIEVDYRFIRYSGKEMDVTRLYYYGARYYADWLGRWISADPAGDVDGPNRYAFVRNNPLNYLDEDGQELIPAELRNSIKRYEEILEEVGQRLDKTIYQFNHLNRTQDIYISAAKRTVLTTVNVMASGVIASTVGGATTATTAPIIGPVAPFLAIATAALAADATGNAINKIGRNNAFGYPLLPTASDIDSDDILETVSPFSLNTEIGKAFRKYDPRTSSGRTELALVATIGVADLVTGVTTHLEKLVAFRRLFQEVNDARSGKLSSHELDRIESGLSLLAEFLNNEADLFDSAIDKIDRLGGVNKAIAAGTRYRINAIEKAVKAKMERLIDLRPRVRHGAERQPARIEGVNRRA